MANFYGYTDQEWLSLTETKRRVIREWTKEQVNKKGPTPDETAIILAYSTEGDTELFDSIFGHKYKYKSIFGSVQDFRNRDKFAYVEDELNAENLARGIRKPKEWSFQELPNDLRRANTSYSGCDITPSITIGGKTFVMGNISTLTYSIHRDKIPVRTLGRSYPKGFSSGQISIAGSLVFTVFDTHVLDEVRKEIVTEQDGSGKQSSPITQQLPPFDITITYTNEYGYSSYMRLYGVEISDESQAHSINDIYTENVMQYVARDIDLMCKLGDEWTPQALAYNNSTIFEKHNKKTPAYELALNKDIDRQINDLQFKLAKQNARIKTLNDLLDTTGNLPESTENTNLINAYLTELTVLENNNATILKQIQNLQNKRFSGTASESTVLRDAMGGPSYSQNDSPYNFNRVKSME